MGILYFYLFVIGIVSFGVYERGFVDWGFDVGVWFKNGVFLIFLFGLKEDLNVRF